VQELFGRFEEKGKDDAENELSRLRFFDAYSEQRLPTEVRDHVRIEGKSGAAADQGKYDMEAVLPVEENLEFRLIYEGEAKSEKDELLIGEALRALCEGEIRIGAKSGWGYGRIHLERDSVERVAFDRSRPEELARFLEFRLDPKKHKAKATLGENDAEAEETGDALTTLEFRIALQMDGPMLVKSAVPRPRPEGRGSELEILGSPERYAEEALYAADHAPVQSRGRAYLPGASLRGVLRAQAL
jgi:CRISPR/Cas system CSM-associated protein Csm3 (group 7 of RAMP superfamily)